MNRLGVKSSFRTKPTWLLLAAMAEQKVQSTVYSDLTFQDFLISEEELMKELEDAREARKNAERQREELVKTAKLMQNKTQNRRNHGRLFTFILFVSKLNC